MIGDRGPEKKFVVWFCHKCGKVYGCKFGDEKPTNCCTCIFVCEPDPDVIVKKTCLKCNEFFYAWDTNPDYFVKQHRKQRIADGKKRKEKEAEKQ